MSVIAIPKPLRDKLGDSATDAFVEVLKEIDRDARKELATKSDLAEVKADIIKWMFIFWVSQIGVMFALLKFMIK